MIRNYLTVAFRNFLRNKNYSLINILGLSIGLTACIVIFLLISYEVKFDKFHSRYSHIYRVVRDVESASGIEYDAATPYPFARAFRNDFPDVPLMTQLHFQSEGFLKVGTEKYEVDDVLFVDSLFFDVFDFEVISGNPKVDLGEPNKAFLTQSLAKKIGLTTGGRFRMSNKLDLEVVGIVKDPPPSSHIQFTMVISMPSFTSDFFGWPIDSWGLTSSGFSYLVLPDGATPESIDERFPAFVNKYYNESERARQTYKLQPLSEIHFDTRYAGTPSETGSIGVAQLVVMAVLGIFILIIACINYINLATALAVRKSREIGIRKTLGARRSQLATYFLSETFLLTMVAILISLGLTEWLLPWLRGFVEKEIYMDLFSNPALLIFLILLIGVATLFSGFYPAVILSGFDPAAVLKNKITIHGGGSFVRRLLVVLQFFIAQVMIIGTLVVSDQMNYFITRPLGFSREAVVNVPLPANDKNLLDELRTRLQSNANIRDVSFAVGAPTSGSNIGTGYYLPEEGPTSSRKVGIKTVDYHYLDTYKLHLKAGRWFNESEERRASDTTIAASDRFVFVVNEEAVRGLGFASPEEILNKKITVGLGDITAPVVGVVEDFNTSSLRDPIGPIVLMIYPSLYFSAGISMQTGNMQETIDFIQKAWTEVYPEYYFHYEFLDDHINDLYRQEARQLVLFRVFAGISIFIGCLGLLGLVSFMANQKTKEVGVRKVFGASVSSIVLLFSKEFVRLVVISFIVAAPLAWYLMSRWLESFEYHIDIHWSVFVVGLMTTLIIALLTVSYRSVKAGLANPVDTLRAE
ncbi:MAG TPA: ABC transporter permease [Cyclobacteriaceae bacterium]